MKVVLDTNVMLSALFWKGPSSKIVTLAERGGLELYSSAEILYELETVLSRDKFVKYAEKRNMDLTEAIEKFALLSTLVTPSAHVAACRDPKDNKFLECALEAGTRYLVSGDKDLLSLSVYEGVNLVSPARFLALPEVRWNRGSVAARRGITHVAQWLRVMVGRR